MSAQAARHPPIGGGTGPVRWRFTDRTGGHSLAPYDSMNLALHVGDDPDRVVLNRDVLRHHLGAGRLATMRPNHGREVALVDVSGETVDVDALVTTTPGLALLALGADCTPALLFDAEAGVIAAVHCGWLGLRDDVFGAVVERMRALGADSITALLGPTICGDCYAVPPDRAEAVAAVNPVAVSRARDGQSSIDIRAGSAQRLARAGVAVELVGGCTAESDDLFSHRRDGLTGRHGAAIMLAAP